MKSSKKIAFWNRTLDPHFFAFAKNILQHKGEGSIVKFQKLCDNVKHITHNIEHITKRRSFCSMFHVPCSMKKRTRLIIMLACVACFLVVAPILVFYSMGYRFDFAKMKITATGGIYVRTYPVADRILIDSKILGVEASRIA